MMNCLYVLPPGKVELRELERPVARSGEALVEVLFSGVSPGTELRCLGGKQEGAPAEGFIPGYQCVGRVAACPDGSFEVGQLVFLTGTKRAPLPCMWGGHVSHAVTPVENLFPLPDNLDPQLAAFAKLAAISHNGAELANVQPGERVAVVGLGPIGFFSAQILTQAGHDLTAYDLSAARVEAAESVGIRATRIDRDKPTHAQVAAQGPLDVIIDCTGVPALLTELLKAGKDLDWGERSVRGVRYLVQGSYPGDFSIPYNAAFTMEAALLFPRDSRPSDLRAVLELMGQGKLGLPESAVELYAPENAQAAYDKLQAARDLPLSVAFEWR